MAFHANLHARIDSCKECGDVITDAYLAVDVADWSGDN